MESSAISKRSAFLFLLFMFVVIMGGSLVLQIPLEFLFLILTISIGFIARFKGITWGEMEKVIGVKYQEVSPAILILIAIGTIAGTWIYSGTVPLLIYYGLKWLQPQYISVFAFLTASLVSTFTGTSWGSVATVGVAFVGIAAAMGSNLPLVAGAAISGAIFGDKISPVSESTVMAAIGAKVSVYRHITTMLYTTVLPYILTIIIYIVLGITLNSSMSSDMTQLNATLSLLEKGFTFNVLLLIPPAFLFIGAFKKYPAVPLMIFSSLIAIAVGFFVQGFSFLDGVSSLLSGFKHTMSPNIANLEDIGILRVLNRGGIFSMFGVILFLFLAVSYAAILEKLGAIQIYVQTLLDKIKNPTSLVLLSYLVGLLMALCGISGVFVFLVIGPLLVESYRSFNMDGSILSRTLEVSVTVMEPMIPWSVAMVFMSTALGVPYKEYIPYMIFNWLVLLMTFILAFTIKKTRFGNPEPQ
ncbi:MAG: Na+/H+ antiporter NhaC family protein [Brevinema sp.]